MTRADPPAGRPGAAEPGIMIILVPRTLTVRVLTVRGPSPSTVAAGTVTVTVRLMVSADGPGRRRRKRNGRQARAQPECQWPGTWTVPTVTPGWRTGSRRRAGPPAGGAGDSDRTAAGGAGLATVQVRVVPAGH